MGQTDGQTGNDESGCERSAESRHRGLILGPDGRYVQQRGSTCKRLRASSTSTGLNYTSVQSSRRDNGRYRIPHEQLAKTYLKRYR